MLQCCEWMGVAMRRACGIASVIFFAARAGHGCPLLWKTQLFKKSFLETEGLSPKMQVL